MRILVVEDDVKIASLIEKGLKTQSYAVDVAFDGDQGYDLGSTEHYDVIIMDRMMPGIDGATLCKRLREEGISTPVLMLTALGELTDKVDGLDAGADDYLTKPFDFPELYARVRALIRRPPAVQSDVLEYEKVSIDMNAQRVERNGKRIHLSKKEYSLLIYLIQHHDQTVSKDQITENVWSFDDDVLPNTVEVYVGYLRKKLEQPFPKKPKLIHTVRGFGYTFGIK